MKYAFVSLLLSISSLGSIAQNLDALRLSFGLAYGEFRTLDSPGLLKASFGYSVPYILELDTEWSLREYPLWIETSLRLIEDKTEFAPTIYLSEMPQFANYSVDSVVVSTLTAYCKRIEIPLRLSIEVVEGSDENVFVPIPQIRICLGIINRFNFPYKITNLYLYKGIDPETGYTNNFDDLTLNNEVRSFYENKFGTYSLFAQAGIELGDPDPNRFGGGFGFYYNQQILSPYGSEIRVSSKWAIEFKMLITYYIE